MGRDIALDICNSGRPKPLVWTANRPRADEAKVLKAIYRHRKALRTYYPHLRIPSNDMPASTVIALLTLWKGYEFSGRCPTCKGRTLATEFGGGFSKGIIAGVCIACAEEVSHPMRGYGSVRTAVNNAFSRTDFRLWTGTNFPGGWALRGKAGNLVAVLQELGADLKGVDAEFEF